MYGACLIYLAFHFIGMCHMQFGSCKYQFWSQCFAQVLKSNFSAE